MFKEKPPLSSMSIIGMRPEIYCLDFFADTPTAKAHWVLNYIDFQIYSKVYKTNLFH